MVGHRARDEQTSSPETPPAKRARTQGERGFVDVESGQATPARQVNAKAPLTFAERLNLIVKATHGPALGVVDIVSLGTERTGKPAAEVNVQQNPQTSPSSLDVGVQPGGSIDKQEVRNLDDDIETLLGAADPFGELASTEPEAPEEVACKAFADRLAALGKIPDVQLPALLQTLKEEATVWDASRRLRSAALLLVYVAKSSRACRAAFVAEGLPLLGEVLQDSVARLEDEEADGRHDACMRALACISCLRMLPIGRATMWEHRVSVGKGFDRLHRWCKSASTALAAEVRGPISSLCRQWRKQPKPAYQDSSADRKALRIKVLEIIRQGLMGIPSAGPTSPMVPMTSPLQLPPTTMAAEIEAALFGHYGAVTPEYRQHARMIRCNFTLSGNAALRNRVLSGDISAGELVTMSSDSLAPQAVKDFRRAAAAEAMHNCIDRVKILPSPTTEDGRGSRWGSTLTPAISSCVQVPTDQNPEEGIQEAAPIDSSTGGSGGHQERPSTPFQERTPASSIPPPSSTPHKTGVDETMISATPDVCATPVCEDEDDEGAALIRWLARPV